MINNEKTYEIVVHMVNWLLLGFIGFIAFFLVVNISPAPQDYGLKFAYIIFMLLICCGNYWYQYRKRKWILPITGTILFVVIAFFLLGVVAPFLADIFYSY